MRSEPVIYASRRFMKNLYRNQTRHDMLIQASRDVSRTYVSQPFPLHGLDRVAGLADPVYEVKISGGDRALVYWNDNENTLTYLDVGDHDVVSRYKPRFLATDLGAAVRADFLTQETSIDVELGSRVIPARFEGENEARWPVVLDDGQAAVVAAIQDDILSGSGQVHFVLGGPGTGKTAILASILEFSRDVEIEARFVASDVVIDYLELSLLTDYQPVRGTVWDSVALLLVDDPGAGHEIASACRAGIAAGGTVVVGFDPFQLDDDLTDSQLERLISAFGVQVHWLRSCYRQKAVLGEPVGSYLSSLDSSVPGGSVGSSILGARSATQAKLDAVDYVNPGGYFRVVEGATQQDVDAEVARLTSAADLWRHWVNLLVAREPLVDASTTISGTGLIVEEVELERVAELKGAEYQHAFLFVSSETFHVLVHGDSAASHEKNRWYRLLRIPLTRAKDSCVVFVCE